MTGISQNGYNTQMTISEVQNGLAQLWLGRRGTKYLGISHQMYPHTISIKPV